MAEQDENKVEIDIKLVNGRHVHLTGSSGDHLVIDSAGLPALETPRKDKLDFAGAPDADNDETEGFQTGSVAFVPSTRKWYRLGVADEGAAEWDILN